MQHTLKFSKMHGLGNDFVVINAVTQSILPQKLPIKLLANRHCGIGFDQLLIIGASTTADFSCQIFNSDGTEAEQCGNGMRCIARFIVENQLTSQKSFRIETKGGIVEATAEDFERITINMGIPRIESVLSLPIEDQTFQLHILSMGNPHAILVVPSIDHFPIQPIGAIISTHSAFPQGTNVGFMEIVNRNHIRLRTFERGAGETFACGSNSCAAVVAGIQSDVLNAEVQVELALGSLMVVWDGDNHPVMMTGPATKVFDGII